jgi:hypothetical protein
MANIAGYKGKTYVPLDLFLCLHGAGSLEAGQGACHSTLAAPKAAQYLSEHFRIAVLTYR